MNSSNNENTNTNADKTENITQNQKELSFYKRINQIQFFLGIVFFIFLVFSNIIIHNKSIKEALKFLTDKYFLMSFFSVFIISYYIFFIKDYNKQLDVATKHALFAYIVSVFSVIDPIKLTPFVLVFMSSYFLNMDL